jgi:hypothetical protein
MSAMSAGFEAMVDALGSGRSGQYNSALGMLGGRGRDARLEFRSGQGRLRTARIGRWLALLRLDPPAGCATTLVWGLDARSAHWSGEFPLGDLYKGRTGLDSEDHPGLLWFRASPGFRRRGRAVTAPGVLEATGLVDAAEVSARFGLCRHVQLRTTFDTRLWGFSADVDRPGAPAQLSMTLKASGVLRPFDMTAIKRWR